MTLARKWHPIDVGRVSVAIIPLSFLTWMLGGANFVAALSFTLLFGIANGLATIMRGAVPLALFGAKGYGEVLGILATPYLLLAAIAPPPSRSSSSATGIASPRRPCWSPVYARCWGWS